jgi:hypothetical protein
MHKNLGRRTPSLSEAELPALGGDQKRSGPMRLIAFIKTSANEKGCLFGRRVCSFPLNQAEFAVVPSDALFAAKLHLTPDCGENHKWQAKHSFNDLHSKAPILRSDYTMSAKCLYLQFGP